MTEAEELEILKDALYHFGYNHQATKCIEEMSELTKELCKEKDGQGNLEYIAEEIADTYITLDGSFLKIKALYLLEEEHSPLVDGITAHIHEGT